MAFQHIRSGDLAYLDNPTFGVTGSDALIPVKVLDIFPGARWPLAEVKVTANRPGYPKGYTILADARSLTSRTPSWGIAIPVWRKES